jgi:geranylgeranyl pyrophosphate synthase
MLWYHLDTGGKRLRPLLALLTTEALGSEPERALHFAAGIELLHNATLIHDDFQDGDTVRRNQPTLWKRYGWEQSINAGDALYFAGMTLISGAPLPADTVQSLVQAASKSLLQVTRGQVCEFRLKGVSTPTESDYLEVISGKTAALFSLPLEGAAICAGASSESIRQLAQVGQRLGLLFQVQDDLLDLLGDKGRGQRGADIAEGKPSLPVVYALNHAAEPARSKLAGILQLERESIGPSEIAQGIQILEDCNAIEYSFEKIRQWKQELITKDEDVNNLLAELTEAILRPLYARL